MMRLPNACGHLSMMGRSAKGVSHGATVPSMSLFDKDLDEVFAYKTPKIVVLKDRRLGFISLGLKFCIFLYIFGWMILHEGKHLSVADIEGFNRLSVRHPTAQMCDPYAVGCRSNYTPFVDLSYCNQSHREYGGGEKRFCSVWDSEEAFLPVDRGLLVPTRMLRFDQVRSCKPSGANNWSCNPAPYEYEAEDGTKQKHIGEAIPKYDSYVADIERFAILIGHGFRLDGMTIDSSQHKLIGHVMACPTTGKGCQRHPIPCGHDDCPEGSVKAQPGPKESSTSSLVQETLRANFLRGKRRLLNGQADQARDRGPTTDLSGGYTSAAADVLRADGTAVAVPTGDAFTLGSLLRMASVDLDTKQISGSTPRTNGFVLLVRIEYSNTQPGFRGLQVTPWRSPHPIYTYTVVNQGESAESRITRTLADPAASSRTVRTYHGVRVVMVQTGSIATWDAVQFLVTMTAALGLMAVSNTMTDLMLMYVLPQSQEYTKRKFFQSKDFHPDDGEEPKRPRTQTEVGEQFLEALEAQDGAAVAKALSEVMELHFGEGRTRKL